MLKKSKTWVQVLEEMNKTRWSQGLREDKQDQGWGFKEDKKGGEIWVFKS